MSQRDPAPLARQGANAFLWGAGGSLVRMVLQLGIQVALARMLGPEVYGLFALGVLVTGVANYFADFGLAYGLIQKREVSAEDVRFVWTWQCLLGIVIGALVWSAATPLAMWFGKPAADTVFAWLALVVALNAMAAPATSLLKKALDFRTLQLAQLASYLAGYLVVGLPLAYSGQGIRALVAAMVTQALVVLLIQYARVRHALTPRLHVPGGWAMIRYGATVLGTNLVNWLLTSMDKLMIGRIMPVQTVGAYTTAFNLVNSPAAALYGNLQSVVFSAGARLQGDAAALRSAFLRPLAGVFLLAFPLFTLLAVGAEFAIAGIYGSRWSEATPYLGVFALAMPWLLVWGVSTPVLWNSGQTGLELQVQLPLVVVWAAVLWSVADQPGPVIAGTAALLFAARAAIMAWLAARTLRVRWRALLGAVAGGVVLSMLCGLLTLLLLPACRDLVQQPQLRLLALFGAAGLGYLALLALLGPWLMERELAAVLRGAAHRLPGPAARLLAVCARTGARS